MACDLLEKKTGRSAKEQWATVEPQTVPNWEAAHIFLEVARCGSFRAASQKLAQSVNALRRKVDEFERELSVPLLMRHVNGVQFTEEGAKIYDAALQMENASFDLLQARSKGDELVEGEVRLTITEGMGTHWLIPKMLEFQRANPKLVINMRCGQNPADLLRLEADISVQLERPTEPDLKVLKLGRLHMMLWAAKSYLDAHGQPASAADLGKHRFVIQYDEERRWLDYYERAFRGLSPSGLVSFRNNVSTAHYAAIESGIGIGALPTYFRALSTGLVALELGIEQAHDIWLVFRADAKRVARVRKTLDWITRCYDPRKYPWFRDEFIRPDRFGELYKGAPPVRTAIFTPNLR